MSIYRIDPMRGFETLVRRANQFANDVEQRVANGVPALTIEKNTFTPRVDIQEKEEKYLMNIELAGVKKEDVKVTILDDGSLSIKGVKSKTVVESGSNYLRNERLFGEFERQFILPENADMNSIQASFSNGVLELMINKIVPKEPKETVINIL